MPVSNGGRRRSRSSTGGPTGRTGPNLARWRPMSVLPTEDVDHLPLEVSTRTDRHQDPRDGSGSISLEWLEYRSGFRRCTLQPQPGVPEATKSIFTTESVRRTPATCSCHDHGGSLGELPEFAFRFFAPFSIQETITIALVPGSFFSKI